MLAVAGLKRLGWEMHISSILSDNDNPYAVGQGALAVTCREDDAETLMLLEKINHKPTRICVEAERSLMRTLEGGCSVPIGVASTWDTTKEQGELWLKAVVTHPKSRQQIEGDMKAAVSSISQAVELGKNLANALKNKGAAELLDHVISLRVNS